jgi:hypothetical protein
VPSHHDTWHNPCLTRGTIHVTLLSPLVGDQWSRSPFGVPLITTDQRATCTSCLVRHMAHSYPKDSASKGPKLYDTWHNIYLTCGTTHIVTRGMRWVYTSSRGIYFILPGVDTCPKHVGWGDIIPLSLLAK